MRFLTSFLLLLLASPAWAQIELMELRVAAQVDGKGPARDGILQARLDQSVTLCAVAVGRRRGRTIYISRAPALQLGGKRIPKSKILSPKVLGDSPLEFRWYKVQPVGESYNNTRGGFHWDEIQYVEKEQGPWGQMWSRPADAHPVPSPGYADVNGGAGTMAFALRARWKGRMLRSPGAQTRFRGGLADSVTRVAFRPSDDFLGYLAELFNTPYIWGSAGVPPRTHQAERLIGSDCADFIVYGARRAGKPIPYKASYHIPEAARLIARAEKVDDEGRFVGAAGKPLSIGPKSVQAGDVLLFPRHVGALVEDRPPIGILDVHDRMIHTYWAPPCIQAIKDTAYADSPVQVLRYDFD